GGTLTNMLTNALKQKVTKLIVKGPINEQDFYTMRDEMPLLAKIDLWEAQTEYIPSQAFCTNQSWDNSIGKKSLTNVRLPKTTRWIGDFSFAGCSNLKEVNFTELKNLEEIYSRAFAWTALNVIDLSQTKLTYVNSEFYQVKNLKNIIFPQTITRLGDVFRGSSVTEIDLSNYTNLKTLEGTFSECRDLVKVTLPEGLTSINWAFNGCEKLTTINLPKSLQVIGGSAFSNTKLQMIDLSGLTELQSIDGSAFSSCYELCEILFPTSLEQIGDNAFSSCNKLTSVDLSNTQLQSISERTFSWCNNLESVKMPKTLETIGNYAFESCNKLSGNLELTSGITRIGDYAFAGTQISIIRSEATVPPVLSSNSMPESWVAAFVPEGSADAYKKATIWKDKWIIDKEVYAEVTVTKEGNLAVDIKDQTHIAQPTITHLKVHGPLGPTDFEIMRSNMTLLYDLDMSDAEVTVIPEKAFLDKKVLMNVKLPASLRTIESYAFKGCSALDGSLALPDGLRLIGWSAFQGCSSLDEVVLNESLEVIQGYAFEGCSSLKQEMTLPRDFHSLGEYAFANCSSLYGTVKFNRDFYMFMGTEGYGSSAGNCFENCSNIEIVDMSEPDFLDEIPNRTFANCTSLKTVLLPQNLDRIDNGAFSNCTSLDNIEFPNTLLVINWDAFQNCTSLSSINLSDCNNLGTIEGHAFEGCSNLETVYLPKSLNWIGEYAFRDCRNLSTLSVEAVQPADLGDYVFDKVRTDRCILSIPTGTYDDYLTAPQWGAFVDMHKSIDVTVGDGANLYVVNDEPTAARGARRTSAAELQGAKVKDGSSLYVQENETAVFKVNPDENVEIAKVLFNGKDVTSEMVNGVYETPGVTAASSFEVQVNVLGDLHVKELRMLDDNVTIKVAEKRQLRFAVYPTNATNQTITWTSSNEKVATVNSDGIITGVTAGSVEITGKTIDGGLEKKCQVVIKPNKYWLVSEEKVEEDIERSVRLPLALHNEDEARDIQFDVWTPENIDMYTNEWDIELNSGRASGHIVSTERISNKVTRVKVSSPTGGKFKNSDGELLTLSFYTGSKGGDFDVAIRNVHITGPNNFDFTIPDHTIRFSMPSYPMGDSNGDGKVTINDAVNTIDYILGRGNERFFWNLTNVNKDGDITVADITGIIDIVLERPSHAKAARKTANNAQGRLYMNDISMTAGKQQTIGMQMENAADFIAFQCDIYLPTGMEIAY
ncbi:MAG: leucine-rich repeat protein, partial [Prevotella sp.]|nr:leucine-rich repeat protein [Prevotella sp.]